MKGDKKDVDYGDFGIIESTADLLKKACKSNFLLKLLLLFWRAVIFFIPAAVKTLGTPLIKIFRKMLISKILQKK